MATKKSAIKKGTGTEAPAAKTAAKKAPAKSATKKTADLQASAPQQTAAAPAKSAAKSAKREPTHEEIRTHAYHLWEKQGRGHGKHHDHWNQAERELKG